MTDEPKISRPKLRLVIEDAGGQLVQYDVQTDNRDAVRFDLVRARKGWPDAETAPMLWMSVCGWSALKRSGAEVGGIDTFLEGSLVDVVALDDDGKPLTMERAKRRIAGGDEDDDAGQAGPFPEDQEHG